MKLFESWQPSTAAQVALWGGGVVLAFLMVVVVGTGHPGVWAFAVFCAAAPMLTAIDFAEHRLPDLITLPCAVLCLLGVIAGVTLTGQSSALGGALAAMAGVGGTFFLMFILAGGAFGFGDVKLGLSMGLCLGTISFIAPFLGPFLGMLIAAVVGVALMIAKKANRKTNIALGPYLIIGTLVVLFAAPAISQV